MPQNFFDLLVMLPFWPITSLWSVNNRFCDKLWCAPNGQPGAILAAIFFILICYYARQARQERQWSIEFDRQQDYSARNKMMFFLILYYSMPWIYWKLQRAFHIIY